MKEVDGVLFDEKIVVPVRVLALCEDCGAEMRPKHTLMTMPPRYVHECTSCFVEVVLNEQYPLIKYKEL